MTTAYSAGTCFKSDIYYGPYDNVGSEVRSVETNAVACQARCASVSGCAYFSFWADGSCHLSSSVSTPVTKNQVLAGPASCSGVTMLIATV